MVRIVWHDLDVFQGWQAAFGVKLRHDRDVPVMNLQNIARPGAILP